METESRARRLPSREPPAARIASSTSSSSADTRSCRSRAPRVSTWSAARGSTRRSRGRDHHRHGHRARAPTRRRRPRSSPPRRGTCSEPAPSGARRIVVVSIIGIDEFQGGYNAAKVAQEQALLEGPLPVRIVRAAHSTSSRSAGRVDHPGRRRLPARDAKPARGRPRRRRNPRGHRRGAGNRERQDQRSSRPAGGASRRYGRRALRQPEATQPRSARSVSPATRTPRPMRRAPCCRTRARSSPAQASKSGSTRIRKADASRLPWIPGDRPAGARRNRCFAWKAIDMGARNATEERAWISTRMRPSSPGTRS